MPMDGRGDTANAAARTSVPDFIRHLAIFECEDATKWEGYTESLWKAALHEPGDHWTIYKACEGELPTPAEAAAYDAIVISGSHYSAYEEHEWIHKLLQLLPQYAAEGARMYGCCFGCQILARALGGSVGQNPDGNFILTIEQIQPTAELQQLTELHAVVQQAVQDCKVVNGSNSSDCRTSPAQTAAGTGEGQGPGSAVPAAAVDGSAAQAAAVDGSAARSAAVNATAAHAAAVDRSAEPTAAADAVVDVLQDLHLSCSSGCFRLIESHGDQVLTLPPGAIRLATSPTATNELWCYGPNVLASQFHVEFDEPLVLEKIWQSLKEIGRLDAQQAEDSRRILEAGGQQNANMLQVIKFFLKHGIPGVPPVIADPTSGSKHTSSSNGSAVKASSSSNTDHRGNPGKGGNVNAGSSSTSTSDNSGGPSSDNYGNTGGSSSSRDWSGGHGDAGDSSNSSTTKGDTGSSSSRGGGANPSSGTSDNSGCPSGNNNGNTGGSSSSSRGWSEGHGNSSNSKVNINASDSHAGINRHQHQQHHQQQQQQNRGSPETVSRNPTAAAAAAAGEAVQRLSDASAFAPTAAAQLASRDCVRAAELVPSTNSSTSSRHTAGATGRGISAEAAPAAAAQVAAKDTSHSSDDNSSAGTAATSPFPATSSAPAEQQQQQHNTTTSSSSPGLGLGLGIGLGLPPIAVQLEPIGARLAAAVAGAASGTSSVNPSVNPSANPSGASSPTAMSDHSIATATSASSALPFAHIAYHRRQHEREEGLTESSQRLIEDSAAAFDLRMQCYNLELEALQQLNDVAADQYGSTAEIATALCQFVTDLDTRQAAVREALAALPQLDRQLRFLEAAVGQLDKRSKDLETRLGLGRSSAYDYLASTFSRAGSGVGAAAAAAGCLGGPTAVKQ